MAKVDRWVLTVERKIKAFAEHHAFVFRHTLRQVSASFEIGCFHALTEFYGKEFSVIPENLTEEGEYRYLTSPTGNPRNFSYLRLQSELDDFELRQQVRIRSYLHPDIAFTPDLVVLRGTAEVSSARVKEYASGKRSFYAVESSSVVAAHECKSLNPFPELLVGFIGMLIAAHDWLVEPANIISSMNGPHLAPTLFVGGAARALHTRMIAGLEMAYPMNVVVGLHSGTWSLIGSGRNLNRLEVTPGMV